jgi:hypothetical protein
MKNVKLCNYWLIGLDDMIKNLIEEIKNQLWNLRWLAIGRGFGDLEIWLNWIGCDALMMLENAWD